MSPKQEQKNGETRFRTSGEVQGNLSMKVSCSLYVFYKVWFRSPRLCTLVDPVAKHVFGSPRPGHDDSTDELEIPLSQSKILTLISILGNRAIQFPFQHHWQGKIVP